MKEKLSDKDGYIRGVDQSIENGPNYIQIK